MKHRQDYACRQTDRQTDGHQRLKLILTQQAINKTRIQALSKINILTQL